MKRSIEQIVVDGSGFTRLALLSDTHGPIHPELLPRLSACDCIVHGGDVGGAAGIPAVDRPVYAVRGNNDVAEKWDPADRKLLDGLPECLRITLAGGDLVVIHGHQFASARTRHAKLRAHFGGCRAILYGHSHRLVIDKDELPWILNPGAGGRARTFGGASFLDVRISRSRWRVREIRV